METWKAKTIFVLLLTFILTVSAWSHSCASEEASLKGQGQFLISDIKFSKGAKGASLKIEGNSHPTFTVYQLFDPLRVVIDIAEAVINESITMPMEVNQAPISAVSGKLLADKEPSITKLEIFLSEDQGYSVNRDGNNIVVGFQGVTQQAPEQEVAGSIELLSAKIDKVAGAVNVLLKAGQPINDFSQAELPKESNRPARIYVDLKGVKAGSLEKVIEVNAGGLARIRTAERDQGVRVVFDSETDQLFQYEIGSVPEGLLVSIIETASMPADDAESKKGMQAPKASEDPVGKLLAGLAQQENNEKSGSVAEQLIKGVIDGGVFAGYDRQKISVDFYKTDLHNVFRLVGSVSGYNMVIEESVSGTLTLSLQEVPWDFLLDIILNLKGLQMEERYNTIVISPDAKSFVWPERITETGEESDLEAPTAAQELVIDEQLSQPPEVIEAKMIMQSGNVLIREGKVKEGLAQYEKAFDAWPENAELAKRISAICLVDLGYNQKAVDYAEKALAVNPEDLETALQAAIGKANMGRWADAKVYFERAVSGDRPARAALLSYAAFTEESKDYDQALAILAKYEKTYNHTLETMNAKARIYDGMSQSDKALAEYKAILTSGYELEPDLVQYINGRIALDNKQ